MSKMFEWNITVGSSVLETKKELLVELYCRLEMDIPLERYIIFLRMWCINYNFSLSIVLML